ncbi:MULTISPECIES: HAD-IA family hydrolase [unclassified Acinetobacter]|uniref:HAD-IA family hydrolase n=1 Tax=unclassified Acinetobacter TaxID=196816 RepID=UPI00190AC05E|nr:MULTISPECIES: HAD-IA family hydrolase [unclassified Acinetobacter]MBK0063367.1 HAD-IA family hydrolase [Acinetobacter sp. S55]MBK0066721.1 HAD-IA family hydrolase [Acinetobacter sp. S54]
MPNCNSSTLPIVLFDMDGTLLDLSFDDFIWNQCLPIRHAQINQCSLQQSRDTLFQFYQQHNHTLCWYSSDYWTAKVGVDVLKLQQEFQHKIQPRPGCFELLKSLNNEGYRCWLVTNADQPSLKLKLENIALRPYFEVLVSSQQLGFAKEDIGFWQTLKDLYPFDPTQVILVDDTAQVLEGAKQFGIEKLITITQPSSLKPARDLATLNYPAIHSLVELFSYLPQSQVKDVDVKTA